MAADHDNDDDDGKIINANKTRWITNRTPTAGKWGVFDI